MVPSVLAEPKSGKALGKHRNSIAVGDSIEGKNDSVKIDQSMLEDTLLQKQSFGIIHERIDRDREDFTFEMTKGESLICEDSPLKHQDRYLI